MVTSFELRIPELVIKYIQYDRTFFFLSYMQVVVEGGLGFAKKIAGEK